MKYLIIFFNLNLSERKETRRHQSFEVLVDGGYQFEDYAIDIEEKFIEKEDVISLRKAILIHIYYASGFREYFYWFCPAFII